MDDRDFFDVLYQQWTKTTGAADTYWMPEEDEHYWAGGPGSWNIWAVDENQSKSPVAQGLAESDAEFITGLHGCLGDLVRRMHMALDEADRLDTEVDERTSEIVKLYEDNDELNERVKELELEVWSHQETLMHAEDALSMIKGESRRQLDDISELRDRNEQLERTIAQNVADFDDLDRRLRNAELERDRFSAEANSYSWRPERQV